MKIFLSFFSTPVRSETMSWPGLFNSVVVRSKNHAVIGSSTDPIQHNFIFFYIFKLLLYISIIYILYIIQMHLISAG